MQVTAKQQIIMEEKINIASWNLRLGLMNKKDYVSQMIITNKNDICCLQEIELKQDCDPQLLSFNEYSLLAEWNDMVLIM